MDIRLYPRPAPAITARQTVKAKNPDAETDIEVFSNNVRYGGEEHRNLNVQIDIKYAPENQRRSLCIFDQTLSHSSL